MGLLPAIAAGGVGQVLGGIGQLAKDLRSAITGEVSPERKAEIEMKVLEIELAASQAQTEINKMEAQHPSVFVAGWRPAIGWTCAFAIAWQFVLNPLISWALLIWRPDIRPPVFPIEGLYPLVMAMLGIGGLRTWEKFRDVQYRH